MTHAQKNTTSNEGAYAPIDAWSAAKTIYTLPNGAAIACVVQGDADLPALLLVHGFTDSSRTWTNLTEAFPGYRLIIPDLRGHGASYAPDYGYSLSHFVDDLRLLLGELGITNCTVVGHSLGGMIAQLFAADFPTLVNKLVLIGTTASPNDAATREVHDIIKGLTDPLDPEGPFMMQWYANPGAVDEGFLAQLRSECAAIPLGVLKSVSQAVSMSDLLQVIGEITADTLIIWGDADPFFGSAQQDAMRNAIGGSKLVSMQGLGHNPNWENPKRVREIIQEFLSA